MAYIYKSVLSIHNYNQTKKQQTILYFNIDLFLKLNHNLE